MLSKWNKLDWYKLFCNGFLILIGSILLALGTAIFLTRLSIVSGGLSGIGIIIQHFVTTYGNGMQVVDIIVWSLSAALWILGWFTCGKEFSLKTLFSTVTYPLFLTLFLRIDFFQNIASIVAGEPNTTVGNVLLCGLFAGVFVGGGVALTFLGKGSTGGTDVLIYIFAKKTSIKESLWSFIIDGTIIILSMIIIPNQWINSLVGIISAFVTAMMIEFLYNANVSSYQVDIISNEWEKISRYAQDDLERGATIIPVKGGHHLHDRIMLRVVLEKRQVDKLMHFIAITDPKAFVTSTQTKAVYGEGFKNHIKTKKLLK